MGFFCTDGREPLGTFDKDLRDVGIGLDVVEHRRLAEQALDRREGRADARLAAVAFDRGHERRLFAADERAGAEAQLDVKIKAAAKDVFAQKAVLARLFDGDFQTVDGDGVFGADVNIALAGANGIAGDGHSLDNGVGVAFQHRTVHKGARITLVGVAADIFDRSGGRRGKLPLFAGGEARAAAAAQAGAFDDVDGLFGGHFGQHAAQGLIPFDGDVFLDVLGVDDAAVAQCDAHLFFIKFGVVQAADGVVLGVYRLLVQKAGDNAALDQMLGDDFGDVLFGDVAVKAALGVDDHDGAERAQAKAAGLDNFDFLFNAVFGKLALHSLDQLGAARRRAAGAAADEHMRSVQFSHTGPPYCALPMVYSSTTTPLTR